MAEVPTLLNILGLGIPQQVADATEAQLRAQAEQQQLIQQQAAGAFANMLGGQTGPGGVGPPVPALGEQNPYLQGQNVADLYSIDPQAGREMLQGLLAPSMPMTAQQQADLAQTEAQTEASRASAAASNASILNTQDQIRSRQAADRRAVIEARQARRDEIKQAARELETEAYADFTADVDEFIPDFNGVLGAQTEIEDFLAQGTALGDASALKKYAMVLEPLARTVTDQDLAVIVGATGQSGVLRDLAQKFGWVEGQELTPEQREEVRAAVSVVKEARAMDAGRRVAALFDEYVASGLVDADKFYRRLEIRGVPRDVIDQYLNLRVIQ